jgi:hypothetical protein
LYGNLIQEEIKKKLNSGNACYHSVQNLLSSRLLSGNIKIRIYKTIILPVVLYGCETWSLTLREEHRLRVFESKVLRRIFGSKRDEAIGDWRKLHNEELHNLYSSPSIIRMIKSRRMRWSRHIEIIGNNFRENVQFLVYHSVSYLNLSSSSSSSSCSSSSSTTSSSSFYGSGHLACSHL